MSRSDRILVAAGGGAIVLALAAASMLLLPVEGEMEGAADTAGIVFSSPTPSVSSAMPASSGEGIIVVDVEGAVVQPGIREMEAGSRVADAIAAAGGYAADADLDATVTSINLAQALEDGEQIVVPRVGGVAAPGSAPANTDGEAATGNGNGALVNLNTATPEELEALPGIGAVTVQKIVAARQEQPFSSLDDAVQRGVIHRGQLEDIQGLATAG